MTTIDDGMWKLSEDELNALCQVDYRTARQSDASVLGRIREMSQRGAFPPEYPSLTAWIAELLALTKKEAAVWLHLVLADVPIAKQAAGEGVVSIAQLGVIVGVMDDIVDDATEAQREHAEQTLTDAAVEVGARGLKGLGTMIKGYLGIDGPAPKDDPDKAGNSLRYGRAKGGLLKLNGERWKPGTRVACSLGARGRRSGALRTISGIGRMAGPPTLATWRCCARTITGRSIIPSGRSRWSMACRG
jgi:hypothetical protein